MKYLKDVVITVSDVEDRDGVAWPYTRVYRFDLDSDASVPEFIRHVQSHVGIIEGGQMKNG